MALCQLYKVIHLKETMPRNRLRFYVFWDFFDILRQEHRTVDFFRRMRRSALQNVANTV